jgi:putative hydrolase of the HAD superfamily
MVKALVFDLYGTLINIRTDEHDPLVFVELSKFLSYNKVFIEPESLERFYHGEVSAQLARNREQYPDVDVLSVFREMATRFGEGKAERTLPVFAARLFRSLSRKSFDPYPGVFQMLERLRDRFPMAIVSDAQRVYTDPEIEMLRLGWFFEHIFISSDYGYRKPEPAFFRLALDALGVKPEEALYIGDNPFRDLFGAKKAGMKMVLVRCLEGEYEGFRPDACLENIADLEQVLGSLL